MTPSMPVATDNIYKFAALFGLALLISVILVGTYVPDKYGEPAFNDALELKILQSKDNLSKEETIKKTLLEEKVRLFDGFARQIIYGAAVFMLIGAFLLVWGGIAWWWKVQPKQDELLNLQIEKMKREIQVLEKQLEKKETR
jgi:hypothetical protein